MGEETSLCLLGVIIHPMGKREYSSEKEIINEAYMRLIKNTIIYFIGNFSTKILAFFMLPLYTQYLEPGDYGMVDTVQSLTQLMVPILFLKISDAVIRFLIGIKDDQHSKKVCVTNTFTVLIMGSLLSAILVPVLNQIYVHGNGVYFYFYFISYAWHVVLQQIVRSLGNSKLYAMSGSLSTVITVGLNLIFILVLNLKAEALILASTGSGIAISLVMFFGGKLYRFIDFKAINIAVLKDMLRYCIPLIPNTLCWQAITTISKMYLGSVCGLEAQGLYAVANRFPSLITMLTSIFYLAWQEEGIRIHNTNERDSTYSNVINIYIKLLCVGMLALVPLSRVYILYGLAEKYQMIWLYTPSMIFTAILSSVNSFLGTAYLSEKNTKAILHTSLIAAAINLIFVMSTTAMLGIWSAVVGGCLAYSVLLVIRLKDCRNYINIKLEAKSVGMCLVAIAIELLLYYLMDETYVDALLMCWACAVCFVVVKPIIVQLWLGVKRKMMREMKKKGKND